MGESTIALERRPVGSSTYRWPTLGIGCGPNAGLFVDAPTDLRDRTVHAAARGGITLFDTAAAYGDGVSERNVGDALCTLGSISTEVVTKVNIGRDDLRDVRGAALRSVESSLERLGRSRLDAVMLHNRVSRAGGHERIVGIGPLLSVDDVLGDHGFATALRELQKDGTVGLLGFTTFGGETEAIDLLLGSGSFGVINAEFNILNPSAGLPVRGHVGANYRGVINRAADCGLGVIAIRVFGGGALFSPPADERSVAVRNWCVRNGGSSVVAGALRFVLSHPAITTAVVGFTDEQQVETALSAASHGLRGPDAIEEVAAIHNGIRAD